MTLRQVSLPGGSGTTHPDGVTDDGWVRPADWLPLPTLVEGQQKLVLLMAVFPHDSNFAAMTIAGAYTVDWGDGSAPVNYATGVTAAKNIAYASATGLTARGYRQVVVTVTPQAGQSLTSVNLAVRSPATLSASVSSQWLDVALVGASVNALTLSGAVGSRLLEQFTYVGPSAITAIYSSRFSGARSLQRLVGTQWTAGIINFDSMFSNCSGLRTIPLLNTAAGTDFGSMFSGCSFLRTIPLLNTAAGTIFSSMFGTCTSLQTIPLLNTAAGTSFSSMFTGCTSLQTIPLLNTAAGTNFSSMFTTCPSLAVAALAGTRYSITCAGKLSAAELNAIYTALGTAAGAQTVTVTGNHGVTGDDPTIATAKGWTVTG